MAGKSAMTGFKKGNPVFFNSIRTKLICILIVLGGLPLMVVGAVSYHSAANALMVQTREQLDSVAAKTVEQIDHFFDVLEKDISLLSHSPFVQLAFLQFEFNQKLDTARRLLDDYSRNNTYFSNIHLVDMSGHCIVSIAQSPTEPAPDFSNQHWFVKTLEQGIFLSDANFFRKDTPTCVILGKTVYDFEVPGRKIGVLAFEINQEAFTHYVASLRIGKKGRAFLIHNKGLLIYHPDHPSGSILEIDLVIKGDQRFKDHLCQMMDGQTGSGDYAYEDMEKFFVYRPCGKMNWSIGLTVFKSELMADIHRLRNQVLTFTGIVFGLFLPVSFLFVNGLTRRIHKLVKGASQIRKGDLDQKITIRTKDEFYVLAEEFNRMAQTLKKNMEEILDLKNFKEDIFRNLSSGIITLDGTGKISSINKSARSMLAISHDDPEQDTGLVRQISNLIKSSMVSGKDVVGQEFERVTPQGDMIHVEVNISKLTNISGGLIGAIADIRDITRRKRMEEQMVRVDKLASLGQLSAGMAHEIRNPLAGMKTSVQVLAEKAGSEDEKFLIQGVLSEIDRLNKIVSDLLSFSRPSQPHPDAIDVPAVLKKVIEMVKEKTGKYHIKVKCQWQDHLPRILADKEQLYQIFLNLILNAITAMGREGCLTLSADIFNDKEGLSNTVSAVITPEEIPEDKKDFLAVRVNDTGQGISKENLSRIFNPFFSTSPKGTGLGLPIVHKLLEKNQGYIFIDSVVGKGTQVLLLLPIAPDTNNQQIQG